MNFSSKSILTVLLVVISIVLGYFFVRPKWSDYSQAKSDLVAAQTQKAQLDLAQQQMTAFLREFKSHSTDAALVNQALPLSQTQMYNILNNLDILTKSSGLTLGEFSVRETPASDQLGASANAIQPINLAIDGGGTYLALKNFMTTLETNLRIMDVDTLNLENSDNNQVKFSLMFRTYYQK